MPTIRLTMAQALVRYLCNQFTIIDGKKEPLFAGSSASSVMATSPACRKRWRLCRTSCPPGAGRTSSPWHSRCHRLCEGDAAAADHGGAVLDRAGCPQHGDGGGLRPCQPAARPVPSGRHLRQPAADPVLQQVEHFGNPTVSVNDAFKAVSRYWDRITHPEQIISSLPQAVATMLDPGDCGPAFIGLCQDTQELAFDYPEAFFAPTIHSIPRPRPDKDRVAKAIELLKGAKRPLIISGGGVRYSGAEKEVADFALKHGIPMAETIAGKVCGHA